jgi:hypothetical protein
LADLNHPFASDGHERKSQDQNLLKPSVALTLAISFVLPLPAAAARVHGRRRPPSSRGVLLLSLSQLYT